MDYILRGVNGTITYIDDVLVHSQSFVQHLNDLQNTFMRLRQYGLKLNIQKSEFGAEKVNYLGYVLSAGGIRP